MDRTELRGGEAEGLPDRAAAELSAGVRAPEPCPACGTAALVNYCASCGEKRFREEDLTLRHFAAEAVEQVTNLDSTLARTFRDLVSRPGELTAAYVTGRRKAYLRPLQLFLLCNVLFALVETVQGRTNVFSSPLQVHMYQLPHRQVARSLVLEEIASREITSIEYEAAFDSMVHTQSKTLVIIIVPLFAMLLAIAQRRPSRPMLEHLIHSLHACSVYLLLTVGYLLIMELLIRLLAIFDFPRAALSEVFDVISVVVILGGMGTYLYRSLRRLYGTPHVRALGKAAALALGSIAVLQLYRSIVFFTTFLTV